MCIMKKLIVILIMLPMCLCAQKQRVAVPTTARDTLYVLEPLVPIFSKLWDMLDDIKKPVIVSVNDLTPYLRKEDLIGTKD